MSIATQKSLDKMKKENLSPWMVERFICAGKFGIRRDLYHIVDIIGIDASKAPAQFVGIQSTTLNQRTEHLKILLEDQEEHTKLWLSTGARLELWCWRKLKRKLKGGGYAKNYSWEPKIDIIKIDNQGKLIAEDCPNVQQQV